MLKNHTKLFIFDLDGTLVNSVPDLANCINQVLQELDLPKQKSKTVMSYMGNGMRRLLQDILLEVMGGSYNDDIFEYAYKLFLKNYAKDSTSHSSLYPNVAETLAELRHKNIDLACVTNKLRAFTSPLIKHFNLNQYFSLVLAGDSLKKKKPDPYPLNYTCKHLRVRVNESVMVGDSEIDIYSANKAGMRSVYMSYGYGNNQAASTLGPDFSFGSIQRLLEIV